MNKRNGFTMVELLATITILGVLMTIAIGSVSLILKKGRENYYTSQRNNLIAAAKSYYQANRSLLPKEIGDTKEVNLDTLNGQKFIDTVYAADKKTKCSGTETKVVVTAIEKNKYKYKSYLKCNEIDDTNTPADEDHNDINVKANKKVNADGTITYSFTLTSSAINIKNYSYTITKNNYHFAGPINGNASSTTVTTRSFEIDKASNVKSNVFYAKIRIVDAKGKVYNKTHTINVGDNKPPTCTLLAASPYPDAAKANWTKEKQTIKVSCNDGTESGNADDGTYVSGCKKAEYNITIKSMADVNKYKNGIKMRDKADNEFVCPISTYIRYDTEPPTCPTVRGYQKNDATSLTSSAGLAVFPSDKWLNGYLLTEATGSTDNALGAGGVYYKSSATGATDHTTYNNSYRNVNAEGVSTVTFQACDKLNNCTTNCGASTNSTFKAKLDRTAPKITLLTSACDSNTKPTSSTINTFTAQNETKAISNTELTYNHSGWLNGNKYPYGFCFKTTIEDNVQLNTRTWAWNSAGKKPGSTYAVLDGSDSPSVSNLLSQNLTSKTEEHKIAAEGMRYGEYTVTDVAGNTTKITLTAPQDRTDPAKPSVAGYRTTITTRTTANDSPYTESSWYKNYVFTMPTGSSDGMSGIVKNQVKTKAPGASEYGSYVDGNYLTITDEGSTNVLYRSCDGAGNCSVHSDAFTVKLDHTPPRYTGDKIKRLNTTYNLWEWGAVFNDPLSGLETTADAGVSSGTSKIYYCYGTSTSCSRHCTKEGSGFDANTHKGTIGDAKDYWLKFARVADKTKYGNTGNDAIVMQTKRACNNGNYTVIGELHIYDRAGNVNEMSMKWDFD